MSKTLLSVTANPWPESQPTGDETARQARSARNLVGQLLLLLRPMGFALAVLLAIVFLCFFGLEMARGTHLGDALRHGITAGASYLGDLIHGELGMTLSASSGERAIRVADVLWPTLSKSLGLLGASLVAAVLLGVPLGAWAARRRRSNVSLVTLLLSLAGMSLPSFFVALLLQMAMIKWVRTFGGRSPLPVGGFGWDTHLVLPALVLATRPLAQIARVTFISLSNVLDQDYVRTAHSKGLSPRSVWRRHVYRNAAIPILTTLLTSLRFSLSSLPVVERFFSWPGIGFNLLRSIARQDDNLTVILLLCLGGLFILVNLVLESTYGRIDPRVREQETRSNVQRRSLLAGIRDTWYGLVEGLRDVLARLGRRPGATTDTDERFRALLRQEIANGRYSEVNEADRRAERRRAWMQGTVGNLPFAVGALLLLALLGVVFLGAQLAPHSPYATQGLTSVDGVLSAPPFAPSADHPWGTDVIGRDIMSLVLVGARRTLSMALVIVLARVGLGFILGALAGWNAGGAFDRLIMGLSEVIAPFPALLLAMILILAVGIREGVSTFIIAFCFVGWGEVMQYVRSEVITIRPQLFIESAQATGLRTLQILYRHVLPNLISALIVLGALEMGAVLMLLAELGFIDIFIGGGIFSELVIGAAPYHYSDVPEWGAMLSNVRVGARSWPWTAIYPSLAFALAILAFNLFGEGLRRMIDRVGVGFTRVINRTTILAGLALVLGIQWAGRQVGPAPYYRQYAEATDGQQALAHVQVLADPALEGRSPGSLGQEAAAEYIAEQFQRFGLQPAGQDTTYFQTKPYNFVSLSSEPKLEISDGGPPPVYRQDFVEYTGNYRNRGEATGQVRWLALGRLRGQQWFYQVAYPDLKNLDTSGDVLLLLSDQYLSAIISDQPRQAILIATDDPAKLARRELMNTADPTYTLGLSSRIIGQETPVFWISEALAGRLMAGTGQTLESLRQTEGALGLSEIATLPTGIQVSSEITGTVREKVPVRHIIGHLPGTRGKVEGGPADAQMDNQLIMVLAQYDGVGDFEGAVYPGANDNASGVAVMLEAIRVLQEEEYKPYRTFLFVAYAGEGQPHGLQWGRSLEPTTFLQAKAHFANAYRLEATIYLRGLGSGSEPTLSLSAGGSQRLLSLFEDAARSVGARTTRGVDRLDMGIVFDEGSWLDSADVAPNIVLSTVGWESTRHTPDDTAESVTAEQLEKAGKTLALALMVMGREEY
jgi:peptide/nickel transport system permease protein